MSDVPVSFPLLKIPARTEADSRSGIRLTSGHQPDRLYADLETAFKRVSAEPVPLAQPVTVVVDGTAYEGLQMSSGDLRVAAAGIGAQLLVVSVVAWDGPLEFTMVTPSGERSQRDTPS